MSLLTLIQSLNPPPPSTTDYTPAITALASIGITTAVDLYFTPLHAIPPLPALSATVVSHLKQPVTASLTVPATDGAELLSTAFYPYLGSAAANDHHSKPNKRVPRSRSSTTLIGLDEILNGGVEYGQIIELAGPKKSGKTLFALHTILLHLLLHPEESALYLDTSNTFSPHRCLDILLLLIEHLASKGIIFYLPAPDVSSASSTTNKITTAEIQEPKLSALGALDRLSVARCLDTVMANEAIDKAIESGKTKKKLAMIVIDSVTTLVGGPILVESPLGQANLVTFVRRLVALSRDVSNPLTIFLINGATATPLILTPAPISQFPLTKNLKPSLGPAFPFLTDLSLWFTRGSDLWGIEFDEKRVIEVARNGRGEARGFTVFQTNGISMVEL